MSVWSRVLACGGPIREHTYVGAVPQPHKKYKPYKEAAGLTQEFKDLVKKSLPTISESEWKAMFIELEDRAFRITSVGPETDRSEAEEDAVCEIYTRVITERILPKFENMSDVRVRFDRRENMEYVHTDGEISFPNAYTDHNDKEVCFSTSVLPYLSHANARDLVLHEVAHLVRHRLFEITKEEREVYDELGGHDAKWRYISRHIGSDGETEQDLTGDYLTTQFDLGYPFHCAHDGPGPRCFGIVHTFEAVFDNSRALIKPDGTCRRHGMPFSIAYLNDGSEPGEDVLPPETFTFLGNSQKVKVNTVPFRRFRLLCRVKDKDVLRSDKLMSREELKALEDRYFRF